MNPCHPDPCGLNAECFEQGETGYRCQCLPDYFGNAYVQCKPECTINSDCAQYLHCINHRCIDPCPGACGFNAICAARNHKAVCECPSGLEGDPHVACRIRKYKHSLVRRQGSFHDLPSNDLVLVLLLLYKFLCFDLKMPVKR